MRVYDFLLSIAEQLGDAHPQRPFRRYPLSTLVLLLNEGIAFVASHRPDLFTDMVIVKLQPGRHQDARCCGCQDVQGVVSQIDADGAEIKDLSVVNQDPTPAARSVKRWYRAPCKENQADAAVPILLTATQDPAVQGAFVVDPPVPVNTNMWVKVRCTHPPKQLTDAAVIGGAVLPEIRFQPALRSYVLYRLLQGQRHVEGADAAAQAELKAAYTYLGVQFKMSEAQKD